MTDHSDNAENKNLEITRKLMMTSGVMFEKGVVHLMSSKFGLDSALERIQVSGNRIRCYE